MKMCKLVIHDMVFLVEAIKRKVVILSAVDRDEGWEINDQIATMFELQTNFEEVLRRAKKILDA